MIINIIVFVLYREYEHMPHNLDISMYSFRDILQLFDMDNKEFTVENMKRAKHKVMMTHPDKSRLPPEYFIFYKKAYEILYNFFEENIKQNKPVTNVEYEPTYVSKQMQGQMSNILSKMGNNDFNTKFNGLFEKHMTKKTNHEKNEWFTNEDAVYDDSMMKGNMAAAMENMRTKTNSIVRYNDVQTLHGAGEKLYDDDEEDQSYIQSNPFSKLKYDDLRKVHKDETIFAVSEKDISKVKIYGSTEQLMQARGAKIDPLGKSESEQMLQQQYHQHRQRMQQNQYNAYQDTMRNEEKNKKILANFLLLK